MKEPKVPLSKLLKKIAADPNRPKSGTKCFVCSEPLVAAEVNKFDSLRRSGDPSAKMVSWATFWRLHLRGQMEWNGTYSALMGHVRNHLGRDGQKA